ncbi:AAA family ATPase [Pseudanabaena sp. Chao 1811]|uniref:AAA family ATPase n=1 Tax=Pseudanabaena sp. Chao 1811 TaxID=2963092 RepID=UPI0022F3969B|nr:AAA family ATPase [Pseudanabaena sp. Chao 1811]
MIRDISIQNFRCFENTSISGFKTVNLITGKNNAGKTALLEALLLGGSPYPETLASLKGYRHESEELDKTLPERAWDYLFYNQDKSKIITIETNTKNISDQTNSLFIKIDDNKLIESNKLIDTNKYIDFPSTKSSNLQIESVINKDTFKGKLIANKEGILGTWFKPLGKDNIPFIPSSFVFSQQQIADEYDKARLSYREKEVLNGLRIVDSSIDLIEYFGIGSPMLYLTRNNEKRLPLPLFGDAINRITVIILSIVNNNSNILLIDEIENGIHYTNQANLWRVLFHLAKEFNVRIFATTHSLEMLTAFAKVGLESEFSDLAAHFEMARSVKTGQIIGIKRDMETLEYSLSHDRRVRGE